MRRLGPTTAPVSPAARRTAPRRSAWTAAAPHPRSLPISPGCGVMITLQEAREISAALPSITFKASASSRSGTRHSCKSARTSAADSGWRVSPGPAATAVNSPARCLHMSSAAAAGAGIRFRSRVNHGFGRHGCYRGGHAPGDEGRDKSGARTQGGRGGQGRGAGVTPGPADDQNVPERALVSGAPARRKQGLQIERRDELQVAFEFIHGLLRHAEVDHLDRARVVDGRGHQQAALGSRSRR